MDALPEELVEDMLLGLEEELPQETCPGDAEANAKVDACDKNSVIVSWTWERMSSMLSPMLGSSDETEDPNRAAVRML